MNRSYAARVALVRAASSSPAMAVLMSASIRDKSSRQYGAGVLIGLTDPGHVGRGLINHEDTDGQRYG